MSKFIDKLNKLTHTEAVPIGFRREQSASVKKKIQLVSLVRESATDLPGIDAILLEIKGKSIPAELLKKMPEDVPWGVWLKVGGQVEVKQLKETGCDFIVFAADTPLLIIEDEDMGKVLEIDDNISEGLLRSVMELPVNAVLVSTVKDNGESLTWRDLLQFQRMGGMPNKPLFVLIPEETTVAELKALWEAGVYAVVVDGNAEALRQIIEDTDFTTVRKRDKQEPVLRQTVDVDSDDED